MRLLLDCVGAFKKMYIMHMVCHFTTSYSPEFLVLRLDQKVCEEWFSHICEPMMNAGLDFNAMML
jgi:PI-3-kinase-related kinase SMG-1